MNVIARRRQQQQQQQCSMWWSGRERAREMLYGAGGVLSFGPAASHRGVSDVASLELGRTNWPPHRPLPVDCCWPPIAMVQLQRRLAQLFRSLQFQRAWSHSLRLYSHAHDLY
jgi:hypothetical protein